MEDHIRDWDRELAKEYGQLAANNVEFRKQLVARQREKLQGLKLAEIDPENHFEYEDQYLYMHFNITPGWEPNQGVVMKAEGKKYDILEESHADIKHLVQDEDWEPVLIGEDGSPYVLTESEQAEQLILLEGNEISTTVNAELQRMDECVGNRTMLTNGD